MFFDLFRCFVSKNNKKPILEYIEYKIEGTIFVGSFWIYMVALHGITMLMNPFINSNYVMGSIQAAVNVYPHSSNPLVGKWNNNESVLVYR